MRQCRDFIMPEGHDAVSGRRLRHLMRPFRVFEGLPGMLVSSLMLLLPMLFTSAVSVGSQIVQLSSALMVFVVGSVVVSRGHCQRVTIWPELVWASWASL